MMIDLLLTLTATIIISVVALTKYRRERTYVK